MSMDIQCAKQLLGDRLILLSQRLNFKFCPHFKYSLSLRLSVVLPEGMGSQTLFKALEKSSALELKSHRLGSKLQNNWHQMTWRAQSFLVGLERVLRSISCSHMMKIDYVEVDKFTCALCADRLALVGCLCMNSEALFDFWVTPITMESWSLILVFNRSLLRGCIYMNLELSYHPWCRGHLSPLSSSCFQLVMCMLEATLVCRDVERLFTKIQWSRCQGFSNRGNYWNCVISKSCTRGWTEDF